MEFNEFSTIFRKYLNNQSEIRGISEYAIENDLRKVYESVDKDNLNEYRVKYIFLGFAFGYPLGENYGRRQLESRISILNRELTTAKQKLALTAKKHNG